jgi:hypothetical protein
MWDDFFALSKRYWYIYVGVLLLEDRVQGWANDQIDKIAPSAAGDVVTTPFLLFIGVIAVLGLLAFLDTRHGHVPVSPPSFDSSGLEVDDDYVRSLTQQLTKAYEDADHELAKRDGAIVALRKERDGLAKRVMRQQEQLTTQLRQIEARDALLHPPVVPPPPELVQFVNAWFMPAWDKAMDLFSPICRAVTANTGEAQGALLEMAVLHPAKASCTAVQERLRGERADDFNKLIADMYRHYESIVRWVVQAERMANWRFDNDSRIGEWRREDDKLLDHLRALVALPHFASTSLQLAFKELDDGGTVKYFRRELEKRDARYSDGT